jgi:RNA 3'-terminal phosphate cyclase (ATP)
MKMIEINGAQGEGGGQIVRSSLALSLLTGKSFQLSNLRAGRKKPGLKRQHLTAVKAAAEVSDAIVTGDEIGSKAISFQPGTLKPGKYCFEISTAGSITLVLQTVLPALMIADSPSEIRLIGGTHNMLAPPFDFLQRSYLQQVNRIGPSIDLNLQSHGFYPAGGGEFTAAITPTEKLSGLTITEHGKLLQRRVRSIVSQLPIGIAQRETNRVIRKLNWDKAKTDHVEASNPKGPGNILFAELEYENVTTMLTAFGQMGVPAERVADILVRNVKKYLRTNAPIGPFLADQLMLPLAIAANHSGAKSKFRTGPLTLHSKTHIDIIQTFLNVEILQTEQDDDSVLIEIN